MIRNHLKGVEGDMINTTIAAASFNIRAPTNPGMPSILS
jgi:hypothetical protein